MAGGDEHGTRAGVVALVVHVLVAAATGVVHDRTGAVSLLAVAIVLGTHAVSHALVLLGGLRARRATERHRRLSGGREHFFWPLVLCAVLLLAAAGASSALGVDAADDPDSLTEVAWAYGVLGGGLLLVLVSLRLAVSHADRVRGRAGRWRFVRTARSAQVPVVLIEGAAALVTLVLAVAAVAAAEADDAVWDGRGAVAIGGVAVLTAVLLVAEIRSLLIGEPATTRDVETIRAAIEVDPAVLRLIRLHSRHQGPDELLVAARVEIDHELSVPEAAEIVGHIERNVRRAVPVARSVYIEVDVADEHRAAPAVAGHAPPPDISPELRAKLDAEARRGSLGEHIVVEDDLG